MVNRLLPCPFCGSEVGIGYCGTGTYEIIGISGGCIICRDGITVDSGGIFYTDIEEVISAWNRREICAVARIKK